MMVHEGLLEATRRAVRAATIGDLNSLDAALSDRTRVLRDAVGENHGLETIPPAERLAALKEGESLHFLLAGIRKQLRDQLRTLEQMKRRLHAGAPPVTFVDLKA